MTRVVPDTNVLVAAAYNPASASRRIVEACPDDVSLIGTAGVSVG